MAERESGGDAGAAERRLAEALGAQASLAAAPTPLAPGSTGATRVGKSGATGSSRPGATRQPHPGSTGPRAGAPSRVGPTRRRRQPPASGAPIPSDPGRPPATHAGRVRRALLVALLAGVLLGCALALLSVLVPGLLPALG